jgi:hypothetical protein
VLLYEGQFLRDSVAVAFVVRNGAAEVVVEAHGGSLAPV